MLELSKLPQRYCDALGISKVAEILGKPERAIRAWGPMMPTYALEKLLAFDPTPLHEIRPLYENPKPGNNLAVIMPSNRWPHPATVESIFRMFDSTTMQFMWDGFNSLYHVRNALAARFLRSGLPWSFWSDDDMIFPCGDAAWFRERSECPNYPTVFAGMHTINRLLSSGKKFVGACYYSTRRGHIPQFGNSHETYIRQDLRAGPTDLVMPVPWVALGASLIHRDVFLDVISHHPELKVRDPSITTNFGYEYSLFSPLDLDFGDDPSFGRRALDSGHQPHVDWALMPAHVGGKPFTYSDMVVNPY